MIWPRGNPQVEAFQAESPPTILTIRAVKPFRLQIAANERKSSNPGSHLPKLESNFAATPRAPYGGWPGPQLLCIFAESVIDPDLPSSYSSCMRSDELRLYFAV